MAKAEATVADFASRLEIADIAPSPQEIAEMLWLASRWEPGAPSVSIKGSVADEADAPDSAQAAGGAPKDMSERGSESPSVPLVPDIAAAPGEGQRVHRAARFRSPAASSLPEPRSLLRALRPLIRRVPSRKEWELDEEETVRRMADERMPILVFRPARERWLDVALVVDESPSLAPWRKPLAELRDLLSHYHLFRNVRSYTLLTDRDTPPRLLLGDARLESAGRPCRSGELIEPGADRLILLLSDTASAGWRTGAIPELVRAWGERHPVALLQLLGRAAWPRSPIGVPVERYRYPAPGAPNRRLEAGSGALETEDIPLPLFTLEARSLANWSAAMAARRHASAIGVRLRAAPIPDDEADDVESAAERYRQFSEFASPEARELMRRLGAVPLTLPIMRLMQQVCLPQASEAPPTPARGRSRPLGPPHPAQIAEILLSGLLVETHQGRNEEETLYEFHNDVRDLLRAGLTHQEAMEALDALSHYVETHLDYRLDFGALALTDKGTLQVSLPAHIQPFAQIAAETAARYLPPSRLLVPTNTSVETQPSATIEPDSGVDPSYIALEEGAEPETIPAPDTQHPTPDTLLPLPDTPHPTPDTRINPIDGAEMVLIPAGEFLMGDDNLRDRTKPAHRVHLDAYYLYKHPVTVEQYQAFCTATRREMPPAPRFNPDWKHRQHPIVNVTWHDAAAYCKWAGVQLPTEAQWEKAARGTDGRKYPWGDEWDPEKCRCSRKEYGDSGGTIEVGSYEDGRSPYGAYDMAGNVWEWCRDLWDEQFYSKPEATERKPVNDRVRVAAEDRPGDETSMSQQFGKIETAESEDPENLKQSAVRVLRGGSWDYFDLPDLFRCAYRLRLVPDDWNFNIGFRPSQGL